MPDYCEALESLSPDNRERLPVVEWLVSNRESDRRSGRTMVLAMALMKSCASGPSKRSFLFDHSSPGRPGMLHMMQVVQSLFPGGGYSITSAGCLSVNSGVAGGETPVLYTGDSVKSLMQDFKAVSRTLVASGVEAEELFSVLRASVVRSVMEA